MHQIDEPVPAFLHKVYMETINTLMSKPAVKNLAQITPERLDKIEHSLYNPLVSKNTKRRLLMLLSIATTPQAFRVIEKFAAGAQGTLHHFALVALTDARMRLHSMLTGEKQVFITGPMGGRDGKLYVLLYLVGENETPLKPFQLDLLHHILTEQLEQTGGELTQEEITGPLYAAKILIPIKHFNLEELIRNTITECNQYGHFLAKWASVSSSDSTDPKEVLQKFRETAHGKPNDSHSPEEEAD